MGRFLKENGKIINKMDKVMWFCKMEGLERVFGKMERELVMIFEMYSYFFFFFHIFLVFF